MWTKICGIRDVDSAREVAAAAPDAVGLNFYPYSSRFVEVEAARRIVEMLPATVRPVGVFVNHTVADVLRTCAEAGIATVQLHGDETPEFVAALHAADPELAIVRAFRVSEDGLESVSRDLAAIRGLGTPLFACLIDSRVPGQYGGTGTVAPWEMIRREYDGANRPPLILAGGLTPDNVAEAVRTVQPWGVDVAGGVENSPGVKDPAAVVRFMTSARAASAR